MDSKMNLSSNSGVEQKQRRVVVYPTQRSTMIVKSDKPRHIPHEPVKGAVSSADKKSSLLHDRVSDNVKKQNSLSLSYEPSQASSNIERSYQPGQAPITVPESNRCPELVLMSSDKFSKACSASLGATLPYHSSKHVRIQTSANVPSFSTESASVTSSLIQRQCHHDPAAFLGNHSAFDRHSPQPVNAIIDSRQTEKNLKPDCQQNIPDEVTRLKEELEVLTKVNSDLKKLLVASIGDDLHFKVDALVRTKVQLANEIGDYARKLVEDYEDLDKLTIQADLWHSKYQASRVLVEQLTSECDQIKNSFAHAQVALNYTIQERHELYELLHLARRNLLALVKSRRPSGVENFRTKCPSTLDLAIDMKRLTDTACRIVIGNMPQYEPDEDTKQTFTPAELFTHQILASASTNVTGSALGVPSSVPAARHPPILLPRFHPGARYEGFTLGCCAHCKGEVIII